MSFMEKCCKSLIVMLNTIVFLVSLCILIVSIYLIVEQYAYNNNMLNIEGASWAVWVPFACSLILCIIAAVGCCITIEEKKFFLCCYGFLQLVFGGLIVAAGAFGFVYAGYAVTVGNTPNNNAITPGFMGQQQGMSDFTFGVYAACCAAGAPLPPTCQESAANLNCLTGTPDASCACIWNPDTFTTTKEATLQDSASCQGYSDIGLGCPPGSGGSNQITILTLKPFQKTWGSYAEKYWRPTAIAFMVFGSLLILAFMGSMYLMCCHTHDRKKKNQQQAGGVAYGQGGNQMTMT